MSINTVIKSNGEIVTFDPNKVNKWAQYASDNGVSWSEIALKAFRKCYDGCKTSDIQQAMIDACVEMEDSAHLKMAGRILLGSIYKEAHGGFKNIPTLTEFYHDMVNRGLWDDLGYTDEELNTLGAFVDHDKNLSKNYGYTALKQMRDKYLMQDLIKRVCHESPQFMFMGVALQSMVNEPKENRMVDIIATYKYLSDLKINLSTPMLVNLRTRNKGLASCCVYTTEDTADSLASGDHIAYMMTCASAGIGSHLTTRSKGDPIRHGSVVHQGKLPYLRMIESAVHANKQACYDDRTKVLTHRGFRYFDDLSDDDFVAQVDDSGNVDFVKPIERYEYDFDGELVGFVNSKGTGLAVTGNHAMVIAKTESIELDISKERSLDPNHGLYEFEEADKLVLSKDKFFPVSAFVRNEKNRILHAWEILSVYLLCNARIQRRNTRDIVEIDNSIDIEFIERLIEIINDDYEFNDIIITGNTFDATEILKSFHELDISELGYDTIKDILELIDYHSPKYNDRNICSGNITYLLESLVPLIGAKLVLGEYGSLGGFSLKTYRIEYDAPSLENSTGFDKIAIPYVGKVYCVEVPTHRLIVRRDDVTMVCGNSRGGANTTYFSVLDPEIEDLIVLKNPTTVLQKRIRNIDYAVNVNRLFVEKVARNEDWYTISYYYAKELHDAFYSADYDLFKLLFEKYQHSEHAVKYKARDIAMKFLTESVETGRLYIHYVDEANRHTPFNEPIYSSNLCLEINLVTKGFTDIMDLYSDDPTGEIGLCSLSSLVQGRITDEEYEDVAYYVTKLVDNTIDIMDYPFPSLRRTAQARRSIGIGITNLAHDLASKGLSYTSKEGKEYIHSMAERHSYWLYRASLRLAKEKGNAEWMHKTKYPEGWTPLVTYNRNVDDVVENKLRFDWEQLSRDIKENGGIRNTTLIAIPPNESSSQLTNTTNSVYPVRSLKVIKTSGTGRNILLAPDIETLGDKYDIAWNVPSKDLIEMYGIIQKFTDQGISPDLYVSYKDSQLLSSKQLLADFILMMKLGCKSRYYINSQSGTDAENASTSGVEMVDGDAFCESCVL